MFSSRIVTTDHYVAPPIPHLDVCNNEQRGGDVFRVPVVRVYGATPAGQKTCMHVHGVFPYLYIPYDGTEPRDRYLRMLAGSIDKALNVALGRTTSSQQHVYKLSLVSGIPFYGYHSDEQTFVKIYLYNPMMVKKVADLLLGGAVMNKVYQPYESHIPYLLQMFIDYNLYGMNLLNVAAVKFRCPRKDGNGNQADGPSRRPSNESSLGDSLLEESLLSTANTTSMSTWDTENIPSELWLDESVCRQSTCELEVDVVAADILNRLEVGANIGTNPGLAALWEDERQRRRERDAPEDLSPPESPDRGDIAWSAAEAELQDQLQEIMQGLQPFISDSESDSDDATPSVVRESRLFPPTPSSQVDLHLSRQASVASSHSTVILEDNDQSEMAVVDESSILRVVSSSQSFRLDTDDLDNSQHVSSGDRSLVQLLAELADTDDTSPAASQLTSQILQLEEQDSVLSNHLVLDSQSPTSSQQGGSGQSPEQPDDVESLEMSQRFWEGDVPEGRSEDDPDSCGYDLGGMDVSWNSSQLIDLSAGRSVASHITSTATAASATAASAAVTCVPESDSEGSSGDESSIPQLDGPTDVHRPRGRPTKHKNKHEEKDSGTKALGSFSIKAQTFTRSSGKNVNGETPKNVHHKEVKKASPPVKSRQLNMKLDLRCSATPPSKKEANPTEKQRSLRKKESPTSKKETDENAPKPEKARHPKDKEEHPSKKEKKSAQQKEKSENATSNPRKSTQQKKDENAPNRKEKMPEEKVESAPKKEKKSTKKDENDPKKERPKSEVAKKEKLKTSPKAVENATVKESSSSKKKASSSKDSGPPKKKKKKPNNEKVEEAKEAEGDEKTTTTPAKKKKVPTATLR